MSATTSTHAPSPALLFDTINAYQRTAAIKAGIELDIFTPVAAAPCTAEAIAAHSKASVRGIRILCDYLTVNGFLTKSDGLYSATPDTALFLNRHSPAYAGGTVEFLLSDDLRGAFDLLTNAVREGGTAQVHGGTIAREHPVWVRFAHSMGPLMYPAARGLAELLALPQDQPTKVLDISASHGMWGLAFATRNPRSHLVALDWEHVLEVARHNVQALGVANRFSNIAGSAFEVELGDDYDVVLLPNFLHHFNPAQCVALLRRIHAALRPGGVVAIVEFVPNPDRVTPPGPASFSLIMLATTPEGDAYTMAEYAQMLAESGFQPPTLHELPASMNVAVIANRT